MADLYNEALFHFKDNANNLAANERVICEAVEAEAEADQNHSREDPIFAVLYTSG